MPTTSHEHLASNCFAGSAKMACISGGRCDNMVSSVMELQRLLVREGLSLFGQEQITCLKVVIESRMHVADEFGNWSIAEHTERATYSFYVATLGLTKAVENAALRAKQAAKHLNTVSIKMQAASLVSNPGSVQAITHTYEITEAAYVVDDVMASSDESDSV